MKPHSKSDLEQLQARAIDPTSVSATGDVYAQGKLGLVNSLALTAAAAAATAVFRTGGAAGTVIANLSVPAGETRSIPYPRGMYFSDGLHVTLGGAGAVADVVGVADAQ